MKATCVQACSVLGSASARIWMSDSAGSRRRGDADNASSATRYCRGLGGALCATGSISETTKHRKSMSVQDELTHANASEYGPHILTKHARRCAGRFPRSQWVKLGWCLKSFAPEYSNPSKNCAVVSRERVSAMADLCRRPVRGYNRICHDERWQA